MALGWLLTLSPSLPRPTLTSSMYYCVSTPSSSKGLLTKWDKEEEEGLLFRSSPLHPIRNSDG